MNNSQASSQLKSVKEGDIITIGPHILGCGKAEDTEFLNRLLQLKAGRKIRSKCVFSKKEPKKKSYS